MQCGMLWYSVMCGCHKLTAPSTYSVRTNCGLSTRTMIAKVLCILCILCRAKDFRMTGNHKPHQTPPNENLLLGMTKPLRRKGHSLSWVGMVITINRKFTKVLMDISRQTIKKIYINFIRTPTRTVTQFSRFLFKVSVINDDTQF